MTDDELMEAMAGAVQRYVENASAPLRREIEALKADLATRPTAEAHAAIVAAIPRPKDGEPVHLDTVRVMLNEAIAAFPPGEPGKDAEPAEIQREVARQFELLKPQLKGEPGEDGDRGEAGFSPDDIEFDVKDERTIVVRFRNGPFQTLREIKLAVPIYRGVLISGRSYEKGDVVTYGGSAFIARCDTSATIGGDPPSPDWQLMVKRGRSASNNRDDKSAEAVLNILNGALAPIVDRISNGGERPSDLFRASELRTMIQWVKERSPSASGTPEV